MGHKKNYKFVNCPFHQDARPSCRVDFKTLRYKCFSCGAEGNLAQLKTAMRESRP